MPAPRANNVNNMNNVGGPEAWFQSLPFITRYWFGATCILTCCANFGIFSPMKIIFSWPEIYNSFEIWRIGTCFMYAGPWHFNCLILSYMLVTYSKQYEGGGPFNTGAGGGTADYVFMLMFGIAVLLLTRPLIMPYFAIGRVLTRNLVFMVLYVWSKRNPDAQSGIWGVPMKATILPFAYIGLTIVMGNPWYDMLHGLIVGHLYYFLADAVPNVHGKDLLQTPAFLIDIFGIGEYTPAVTANPQQPPQQGGGVGRIGGVGGGGAQQPGAAGGGAARGLGGGHTWGSGGQRLGSD